MRWGRRRRRAKTQPGLTTSSPGWSRPGQPASAAQMCSSNLLLSPQLSAHEWGSTPQLGTKESQKKKCLRNFMTCLLGASSYCSDCLAKHLTEREGVEAQARQGHATNKPEQAEEGEGVGESDAGPWHRHQQVRDEQEDASAISRSQVGLQRLRSVRSGYITSFDLNNFLTVTGILCFLCDIYPYFKDAISMSHCNR